VATVVDTDVFSFAFKKDSREALYKPHLDGRFLFLSFMTVAELELWALVGGWGVRNKARLAKSMSRYSVHQSTTELCSIWAGITQEGRQSGKSVATADAWIAATALLLNLPLITHNASDFNGIGGLKIITETE
jgi:tRNA(fMet)-specific endonuclease VapC